MPPKSIPRAVRAAFLPREFYRQLLHPCQNQQPLERSTTLFSAVQLPISSLILTLQSTLRTAQEMKNKCRCCACKGQPTLTTGCSLPPVFAALRIRFKIIKHFFFFFKIYSLFSAWQRKISFFASNNQNISNTASLGPVQCLLLFCSSLYLLLLLFAIHPHVDAPHIPVCHSLVEEVIN